MDHSASSENSGANTNNQNPLDSIFEHPEGLQTARNLVQAVYSNWVSQNSQPLTGNIPGTSSEIEGILNDILAFSSLHDRAAVAGIDAEGLQRETKTMDHTKTQGEAGSARSARSIESSRDMTALHQPSPRNHASSSALHSMSQKRPLQQSVLQRLASENSAENEIRSIFATRTMANVSVFQGTESPYRVESPADSQSNMNINSSTSNKKKGPTSAPNATSFKDGGNHNTYVSSSLVGDGQSRNAESWQAESSTTRKHVSSMDMERFRTSSSVASTRLADGVVVNNHKEHNINHHIPQLHPPSTYSISYAGLPTVSTNLTRKDSPTIKSFLPVNKQFTHNNINPDDNSKASVQPQNFIQPTPVNFKATNSSSRDRYFFNLQSPSPPPSFSTPQRGLSPTLDDLSSPCLTENESETDPSNMQVKRKRKTTIDGASSGTKRQKGDLSSMQLVRKAARKAAKAKQSKSDQAKEKLPQAIWMRILEFTPPHFLTKARLINKTFKAMVDQFDSIFINCRKENFGWDMPPPPRGLTERQYSDLFGGKGCLEPDCDDQASSRTHWSWAKRWCQDCWKNKIEREDRAIKKYQNRYVRPTLTKLFECIPVGVHDSFMKPHDYIDNIETRERQAPRLYKYYLIEDVQKIIEEFEALAPAPFVENPNDTDEQKAWARSEHQKLVDALEEKQNEFFATRKKANDEHMARVQRIETAVREKRSENRKPNTANRDARKALFLRRANEDLPEIPATFVRTTKAFKAATRIFRDAGTERGWQTLKPKIQKEWEDSSHQEHSPSPGMDRNTESDDGGDMMNNVPLPTMGQHRGPGMVPHNSTGYHGPDLYGLGSASLADMGSASMHYRNTSSSQMPQIPSFGGMCSGNANNRNMSHSAYLAAAYALPPPLYSSGNSNANYGNNANQYHQLMGGNNPYHNNRHFQQQGSHPTSRPMSIPSLLQDNPQMLRYSHAHHPRHYMG